MNTSWTESKQAITCVLAIGSIAPRVAILALKTKGIRSTRAVESEVSTGALPTMLAGIGAVLTVSNRAVVRIRGRPITIIDPIA